MTNQPAGGGRLDLHSIAANADLIEIAGRYLDIRRAGSEYEALCPFHADGHPSFTIYHDKHGTQRFMCFACGERGDAIDFVAKIESVDNVEAARRISGDERAATPINRPPPAPPSWRAIIPVPAGAPPMDPGKLWNAKRDRKTSIRPTRRDEYRTAAGELIGYVLRAEMPDGRKWTPTVTYAEHVDGRRAWALVPFPSPRPLQGLDDLEGRPTAPVLIVSGEKCRAVAADYLSGFVVVTWPGGDNAVGKVDFIPLDGRNVTLWPDADKPGRAAMSEIAGRLRAPSVRMLDVDGLESEFGEGADIADLVDAGWDTARIIAWAKQHVRQVPQGEPPAPEPPPGEKKPAQGPVGAGASAGDDRGNRAAAGETERPTPLAKTDDNPTRAVDATPVVQILDLDVSPPATILRAELDKAADPDADGLPEMYSEDNVALRFSQIYADDLRYVAPWGRWMRWTGQRWAHEDTLEVFDFARKVCRSVAAYVRQDRELTPKQQQAVATKYGTAQTIASIERLAKADRRHAATIAQWDADVWALNTPGGVVDLRTGEIRQGDRGAYMTKITRVAPGSGCPAWLTFLQTATGGDTELIGFLRRMAGYCLTGATRDHALFFVYGPGGNGKGTFLNTLQWILGDYNKTAGMDVFTEKKHESHPTELAALMGARMVTAQETEEGKRWAEARIKALTGGDPITARFMRQDDFTYDPQFKLVIAGNHKPGLRNVDEAIKRRMHLIPFTVTIPAEKRDARLSDRLRAEAGGILAWAIDGCIEWQRDGLRPPQSVQAATAEYLEQEDQFANWITECCEVGASFNHASKPLYGSYKAWCDRANEYAIPQKRWAAQMAARGFSSIRKTAGVMYSGIRVSYENREDFQ